MRALSNAKKKRIARIAKKLASSRTVYRHRWTAWYRLGEAYFASQCALALREFISVFCLGGKCGPAD
jgi:hypothetical protein